MMIARISRNGTVNLPSKVRKKLGLKVGDEIGFLETPDGIVVVPLKSILDMTDPAELPIAKKIIEEIHEERRKER